MENSYDVLRQSLPAGIDIHRMTSDGTDEDSQGRRCSDDVSYTPNMKLWRNTPLEYIGYQFFSGIEVTNRNDLNDKDLHRTGTRYKEHLLDVIEDSKGDGAWTGPINEKEVKERKQKWTMIKGRGKVVVVILHQVEV